MPSKRQHQQKPKPSKAGRLKAYAKYSGLAFQMLAIILLGTFGGFFLDNRFSLSFPVFTFLGVIVAVVMAIYYAIKDLLKK